MNLHQPPRLEPPPGTPERCAELAARALQARAIVDLALEDDGGALSAAEVGGVGGPRSSLSAQPRAADSSRRAPPRSGPSEDASAPASADGAERARSERSTSELARESICTCPAAQVSCQTASALPAGSVKWKRRPPGNSNGSSSIVPPAACTAAYVASRSSL